MDAEAHLAEAQNHIKKLEAQINLLQQAGHTLEKEKQELLANFAEEVRTARAEIREEFASRKYQDTSVKVAKPDDFDGSQSKVDSFLRQLSISIRADPTRYLNDDNKITLALSYMKGGSAGAWADRLLERAEEDGTYEYTWEEFKEAFRESFGDADPSGTACNRIDTLEMGKMTADEYIIAFEEHEAKTGYNDKALKDCFERGLHRSLARSIYALEKMPEDLKGWKAWARKLDRQHRKFEAKTKLKTQPVAIKPIPQSQTPRTPAFIPKPRIESQFVPMDVDQARGRKGNQQEGRPSLICWKCRKPGHRAVECKEKFNVNSMTFEEIRNMIMEEEKKKDFQE
jgi:Ty3 transposon capsid-like protein/zinc knuckle protein